MKIFARSRLAPLVPAFLLVGALAARPADAAMKSATIAVPRHGSVAVELREGPVVVRSVHIDNRPDSGDMRKARRDPDDTTRLKWVFDVGNGGRRDWKLSLAVRIYDEEDHLLGEDSKDDKVSSGKLRDHITVSTKIHTIDWRRAHHAVVEASFRPD